MPVLSSTGDYVSRKDLNGSGKGFGKKPKQKKNKNKNNKKINQTPKNLPKKGVSQKVKRNKISEEGAKRLADVQMATRLRRMFRED